MNEYTVIWKRLNKWNKTTISGDFDYCKEQAQKIERMGYVALVCKWKELQIIGLPDED